MHATEKTVETQDSYMQHILTMKTSGMHGPGEKLNEICPTAKNAQND